MSLNMFSSQKGISLLEVLVGFVIFTSSLVAVLDYVSGQVYLFHLSSNNQQKVQMVYDLSIVADLGIEQQINIASEYDDFDWSVSSSLMDSLEQREGGSLLNRSTYSIVDSNGIYEWTVLNIKQVE